MYGEVKNEKWLGAGSWELKANEDSRTNKDR